MWFLLAGQFNNPDTFQSKLMKMSNKSNKCTLGAVLLISQLCYETEKLALKHVRGIYPFCVIFYLTNIYCTCTHTHTHPKAVREGINLCSSMICHDLLAQNLRSEDWHLSHSGWTAQSLFRILSDLVIWQCILYSSWFAYGEFTLLPMNHLSIPHCSVCLFSKVDLLC